MAGLDAELLRTAEGGSFLHCTSDLTEHNSLASVTRAEDSVLRGLWPCSSYRPCLETGQVQHRTTQPSCSIAHSKSLPFSGVTVRFIKKASVCCFVFINFVIILVLIYSNL